ncbi:hypothetical protein CAOG_06052 [Capsaspora owczarzaki ATCC 30864]|uniref:ER membrane protein complex subunit 1 n=1 Tax=Capsaspora owczarzaki (strain ATCC 30864) TaxID=595528 RepID=A0A0D2X485_CAPO3|nr:hypothetical protein CAOG_06052 [Capsaspora owczarzaki ATCC 30864]KJE95619.1 hypothetical protein CAOG_006052 [Capsaspora owczarzaki ATCC 30864]|eukprot:XP_004345642.2 hypothetical protein CAOG_06052 [Capsaspora owczarzaki ATCC 30864]
MRLSPLLLLLLAATQLLVAPASAIYEDQAGLFDWRFQAVGAVKFAILGGESAAASSSSSSTASHYRGWVFVATESNAVAALSSASGDIVWRQVFSENDAIDGMILHGNGLFTLSENGRRLRKWLPEAGTIVWEHLVDVGDHSGEAQLLAATSSNRAVVVVVAGGVVAAFDASGQPTASSNWQAKLPEGFAAVSARVNADEAQIVGRLSGALSVVSVDFLTAAVTPVGTVADQQSSRVSFFGDDGLLLASLNGALTFASISKRTTVTLQSSLAKTSPIPEVSITLLSASMAVVSFDRHHHVFVHQSGASVAVARTITGAYVFAPVVNKGAASVVAIQVNTQDTLVSVWSLASVESSQKDLPSPAVLPALDRSPVFGDSAATELPSGRFPWRAFTHATISPSSPFAALVVQSDGRLVMLTVSQEAASSAGSNRALWAREEALASVVQSEFADLPSRQADTLDHEFGHSAGFVGRITTQTKQLLAALLSPASLLSPVLSIVAPAAKTSKRAVLAHPSLLDASYPGAEGLTPDNFGFRKVIVAVTETGSVFGLSTDDGAILWKARINSAPSDGLALDISGSSSLFVLRTTAHFPLPPAVAIVATGKGRSVTFVLNPITGKLFPTMHASGQEHDALTGVVELPFVASQVLLLPTVGPSEARVLLFVNPSDTRAETVPKSAAAVAAVQQYDKLTPIHVYSVEADGRGLRGYSLEFSGSNEHIRLAPTWTVAWASDDERVAAVASRASYERINSVGRVLGDRNVLYKYLNPSMLAVGTLSSSAASRTSRNLHVYVINTVTGAIIFRAVHDKASVPVIVQCENWVVYQFWNAKARRTEITVLEMFEDESRAAEKTTFSAFDGALPTVLRQSFIFPTSISTMAVTTTVGGITNKQILAALPAGWIFALDKFLLDPRRPVGTPSEEDKEEGLIPYMAELPFMTTSIINYNQTISRLRGIHTGPAALESASLVFAHGVDIFHTRVHPSKTFDVLNEDFNFFLLMTTLVVLIVGTIVSSSMLKRKRLEAAWQ